MRTNALRKLLWILGTVVLVSAVAMGLLAFTHHRREKHEHARLDEVAQKGPRVYVAQVERTEGQRSVTLPGDVRAFHQASIFAKVQGYVREVKVDKGERVQAGQVLAIIESPETDQQVGAAQSDVALKRRTALRTRALAASGIVSQQEVDLADGDLEQSRANLKRLQALQEYQVLRAPFDGVVTARYMDPGALIPATSSGMPLVEVVDPDQLRITVYAGQDVAAFLHAGDAADIVQDEHPERVIHTKVTRLADAYDPRTRTMLAEIELDNHERLLIPGVYVHVTLHLKSPPLSSVPNEALLVRGDKTMVAVVKDNQVKLQPVDPGLNDGKNVQLKTPLEEGQVVALNLPIELGDGSHIQPVERPQRDEKSQATGGSGTAGQGGSPDKQMGRQQAKRAAEEPQETKDSKDSKAKDGQGGGADARKQKTEGQ